MSWLQPGISRIALSLEVQLHHFTYAFLRIVTAIVSNFAGGQRNRLGGPLVLVEVVVVVLGTSIDCYVKVDTTLTSLTNFDTT